MHKYNSNDGIEYESEDESEDDGIEDDGIEDGIEYESNDGIEYYMYYMY